jgi:L-threonylcarbamoyladenylate synthase
MSPIVGVAQTAVAVDALRRGEAVVYPTETLYGLGVDAWSERALELLASLKVRPDDKPISVLISSRAMLDAIAERITPLAGRLIARFWPGPLTLVVTARPSISRRLTAGAGTIGVRLSSHPVAAALVTGLGGPLTTTSANPAGAAPATTIDQAKGYFGSKVAVYVDGGTVSGGVGSTVVDVTGNTPRVLREGAVSVAALHTAVAEAA